MPNPSPLPTGTVTFLFTDVEGSTRLWELHPAQMREALVTHDAIVELLAETHGGQVVRPRGEGDSRFCVFARATDAAHAAAAIQRALHAEPWPPETPLKVRLALHTGEADLRDGDYYGSAVNRAARLRSLAHGGQTLLSQATFDLIRDDLPPGTSTKDLGEHRLKDLGRPERAYQLLCPDLPSDFPPLKSLDTLPNNLPLQVTSFVGREKEMAEVAKLLGTVRLLTLTGPGGTGKTRLSLQVAADALDDYPGGVFLVELAPVGSPAEVPAAVAAALGVREEEGRPLLATLTDALRPKCLLLVLDNCEHLVAACASLADHLIRTCPTLSILATSREGLGIAGETSWRVPSLALPSPERMPALDALTQYEAVQLFIDRAKAAVPAFAITERNAPAVAQICHRLDGIPLALELAAARLKALPVDELVIRLEDRFRLLTGGSRTALPRQQTLQALVDWSYTLLPDQEKTLFSRLAVFYGGFTLQAAETVCAGGIVDTYDVVDLLTRLVDKSLVLLDELPDGTGRYRLLETLRQYARQKLLDSGEAEALHARHATHFLGLAEDTQAALRGAEQDVHLRRLALEHENFRAALRWLQDTRDAEHGLRLASALFRYWLVRGWWSEGREWLDGLLTLAGEFSAGPTGASPAVRARALKASARLAYNQGDRRRGRELSNRALALFRELGDQTGEAGCLTDLGASIRGTQRAEALDLFERALAIHERHRNREGICQVLHWLGHWYDDGDDAPAARTHWERALALSREDGDLRFIALLADDLGTRDRRDGRLDGARRAAEEAVTLRRLLDDRWGLALSLMRLAALDETDDRWEDAERRLLESHAMWRDLGARSNLGVATHRLADHALRRDDDDGARRWLGECLDHAAHIDGPLLACAAIMSVGAELARRAGDPRRALRLAAAGATLRRQRGALDPLSLTQRRHHSAVEAARQALPEDVAAAAWAEGEAMSLEDAIADARDLVHFSEPIHPVRV